MIGGPPPSNFATYQSTGVFETLSRVSSHCGKARREKERATQEARDLEAINRQSGGPPGHGAEIESCLTRWLKGCWVLWAPRKP